MLAGLLSSDDPPSLHMYIDVDLELATYTVANTFYICTTYICSYIVILIIATSSQISSYGYL